MDVRQVILQVEFMGSKCQDVLVQARLRQTWTDLKQIEKKSNLPLVKDSTGTPRYRRG